MLVRVKKGLGNYGHIHNGFVQPKNYVSGAFEVSEAKGKELIKRGIVDVVEGDNAPATDAVTEAPQPAAEKTTKKQAKKKATKAEESAEDAPTFDATGGVE